MYETKKGALYDLKGAAFLVDGHLSAKKFEEKSGRTRAEIITWFSSWNKAKSAAGLGRHKVRNDISNAEKQRRISIIKDQLPCSRCGDSVHPVAMDFHHINKDRKKRSIRDGTRIGWDQLQEELKKCDLVCANCHRIIEHTEYGTRR